VRGETESGYGMRLTQTATASIPFSRPFMAGNEYDYIRQAIESGQVSGGGAFTRKCQKLLEDILGVPKVLLTKSGTGALELSALLLNIRPGDEVIVPSFTFVSTVNAFVLRGARPVFLDIRPDTLNLDESQLALAIGPNTRAIVPVHYAGVGCEMDSILKMAGCFDIPVVEDNAHGLFGEFRGKRLGTFGALAALSFHETNNISCGEGGALLINDPALIERAEILCEKGTNRSRLFRGQADKCTWVDVGSSFLPSDILAAFLYAQLENRETIQSARGRIWNVYANQLSGWARGAGVYLPRIPAHCEQPYHMFYMLMPSATVRDALIAHLKRHGIVSVFHYQPLHLSEMGRICAAREPYCPVTEQLSERLVRLPFFNGLTEDDQAHIVDCIREFRG
jgi:dTDP-4-amino-4,6-dideoxygalactose transaminase